MFKDNPVVYWLTYRLFLQSALTQTTHAEQGCLAKHATDRKKLIEIGVWHGVNTRKFREVMSSGGTLYAVDPFPPGRFGKSWQKKITHREARMSANGKIVWLEQYSDKAFEAFMELDGEPIDFMFIDGDHSYEGVQTDWQLWSPLVVPGGVVALHDSRSYELRSIDHVGAARFTRDVILADSNFEVVDTVDSVTVVQRRPVAPATSQS